MKKRNPIMSIEEGKRAAKRNLMEPWKECLLWGAVICLIGWAAFIMLT